MSEMLIIGWIPLYYSNVDDVGVVPDVSGLPEFGCHGVFWSVQNDVVVASFVLDGQCKELAEHINWYSESRPEVFFKVVYDFAGVGYKIAFIPRVEAVVQRTNFNRALKGLDVIETNHVYFGSVFADCMTSTAFQSVLSMFPNLSKIGVNFVDSFEKVDNVEFFNNITFEKIDFSLLMGGPDESL